MIQIMDALKILNVHVDERDVVLIGRLSLKYDKSGSVNITREDIETILTSVNKLYPEIKAPDINLVSKKHKKFRQRVGSKLVGCEAAVAFFLKKDTVDQAAYDPDDKFNEILYSLALNPEIYSIYRLAALLTKNEEGDKIYEDTVKKHKLKKE